MSKTISRVEKLESFPSRVSPYTYCVKRNTVSLFHIRVRPYHELKNWKVFLFEYGLTRIALKGIQSHFFYIRVRPYHELKNWKVFLLEYGLTRIVLKEIQSHFFIRVRPYH